MHAPPRHTRSRRTGYALAGTLLVAGCSHTITDDTVACTAVFVPGVVVDVRDSVTGAELGGARGVVRDGAYVDSLRARGTDSAYAASLTAAGERAGTYDVAVVRPGYRPFTAAGLVVTRDACHVRTQRVRAALVPGG